MVKSMAELKRLVDIQIASAMKNEVAQQVKEVESDMVEQHVYDKYEPYKYVRRGENDGLADTRNMMHEVTIVGDMVKLTVTNETGGSEDRSMKLADLVEHGDNSPMGYEYDWKTNRDTDSPAYLESRPFQAETLRTMKDGEFKQILWQALKARGLDIKLK